MLVFWLMMAATLGQATQPANPPVLRPTRTGAPRISVAPRGAVPPTTAPAETAPRSVRSSTTRPARGRERLVIPPAGAGDQTPGVARPGPAVSPVVPTTPREQPGRSAPMSVAGAQTQPAVDAAADPIAMLSNLSGDDVEVEVTSDGTIVLYGNANDIAIWRAFIQQMEQQSEIKPAFKVIRLENAQANNIASQVASTWNQAYAPRSGSPRPEDRVTIIPQPQANLLMIATAEKNMASLESLIQQLDQSTLPAPDDKGPVLFRTIPLKHINATEAETTVRELLKSITQRRDPSGQEPATIRADTRTGQLLVSSSDKDFEQIKTLVETIDVAPTATGGGSLKLALFPLKKAVAKPLATALTDMLTAPPAAGGGQATAMKEQIRRLQMINMREPGGQPLADLNLERPIKVWGEEGTNSVIVATIEENLAPMGEIIRLLDSVPLADDIQVRVFALEFADAEPLATNLKSLFDQGSRLPEQPGRTAIVGEIPTSPTGQALAYPIGIAFDKRTNVLIVSGRAEQLTLVESMVKQVDQKSDVRKFVPRLVHLEHADVKAVADLMTKLGEARQKLVDVTNGAGTRGSIAESVLIIPDLRTNSLIVVARDDVFEDVVKLAKELDNQKNRYGGQFKIVNLTNLTAVEIADKASQLWKRRNEIRQQQGLQPDNPVIVADARSNSMIISANPEDTQDIINLVNELEAQKLSPMMEIRTITVENNDAKAVGDAVQNIFQNRLKNNLAQGQQEQPSDRVAIITDPVTRTLLVASTRTNFEEIAALVKKLDTIPESNSVLRTFVIQNADVTSVADIITKLFQGGVFRQGGGVSDQSIPEAFKKVTVVAHERSSSVLVSASPDNLALVAKLIEQLDEPNPPTFAGAKFFKLENRDPVRVADLLDQLLQGIQVTIQDKTQMQYKVIPDASSRTLLVSGTRFALQEAENLIPKLDSPAGTPASETRVYALKHGTARQIEPLLTDLFDKRSGQTQAKATPILVQAEEGSNSLIVTAAAEEHLVVEHLLSMVDRSSNLAQQMRIFALEQARAEDLATTLTDLIKQQGTGGTSGSTAPPVAITPENRTNSLVVFAPADLMSNVEEIIKSLDTNRPKANLGLRVFKLNNAKAEDMATRLQEFFEEASTGGGGGGRGGSGGRQMIIRFMWRNPETGLEEPRTLVHQDITVKPDPATNSLMVLAPYDSIDMMAELVEMLDNVELQTAKVRVFQLRNADAENMRNTLEELFKASTGTGSGNEGRTQLILGAEGGAGGGEGGSSVDLAFSVDQRTNSLIAAGSPANLRTVEDLVFKLDYTEIEDRVFRVVHLLNAKATDVSTAIQAHFDAEKQILQESAGDGEAAARQMERSVSIQDAGETQNTLLISYSPRMETEVFQMIKELDLPPPQVMIQVLMAEVTLDDRLEMGLEFALQDLNFSERSFTRNGVLQGPNFDKVGGTDLGAQGQSGLGGISFTITGEDFNFLVRALQTEGRLEVLSRPAILVQDNQEAEIHVGESVPTIQDLTVSTGGVVTPSVSYVDVGVKLNVTPIINPDGFVNMEIEPEISAIGTSSVTVASGVSLPTFTTRRARTSVTVKDGETIIIGGLITNRENNGENKVPLAGDLPLIGPLFRATVKTTTKTELLMVLTPHVIRDAEQARRISLEMRDQTGLMENARRSPMMGKLQVRPDEEQFGPSEPLNGPPSGGPARSGDEYGPVLDEYGPPMGQIKQENPPDTIQFGPARSLARTANAPKGR